MILPHLFSVFPFVTAHEIFTEINAEQDSCAIAGIAQLTQLHSHCVNVVLHRSWGQGERDGCSCF